MILQLYLNHTSDGSMQPCSNTNFLISFSVGGMMNGWAKTLTISCAIMGLAFLFAKTHTSMHGHNGIHAVASNFKKQVQALTLYLMASFTNWLLWYLLDCINCEVIMSVKTVTYLTASWKKLWSQIIISPPSSSILQLIPSALPSCCGACLLHAHFISWPHLRYAY